MSLAKHNLSPPADGWGELRLEVAEPFEGKEWTDTGKNGIVASSSSER